MMARDGDGARCGGARGQGGHGARRAQGGDAGVLRGECGAGRWLTRASE